MKYNKYNFLRGRIFVNIPVLQGENIAWHSRTANAKVHSTTMKIPHDEWLIEKSYLNPVMGSFKPEHALDTSDLRKEVLSHLIEKRVFSIKTKTIQNHKP